ncbi:MAG: YidB family protein [Smithella sp.]
MGLFDKIISMASGGLSADSGQGGMLNQVLNIINNPSTGGIPGLIEKFQNGGLGEVVSSWIGTGENQPVSGDQITNTLGADKIKDIAASLGVSDTEAADGLASMLPQLIDRLTPEGKLPEGNALQEGLLSLVQKIMKG